MTREKAIDRLIKCLRLAKSTNPHEAAAALRQAQKLMQRHGLTHTDAQQIGEINTTIARASLPPFIEALISLVATSFACRAILMRTPARLWRVSFVGTGGHPQVAAYAFTILRRQLERARKTHIKRLRSRIAKIERGALYAMGWVRGIQRAIETIAPDIEQSQAIDTYLDRRYPRLDHPKTRTFHVSSRYLADHGVGFQAGRSVSLHHGVAGTNKVPSLVLANQTDRAPTRATKQEP